MLLLLLLQLVCSYHYYCYYQVTGFNNLLLVPEPKWSELQHLAGSPLWNTHEQQTMLMVNWVGESSQNSQLVVEQITVHIMDHKQTYSLYEGMLMMLPSLCTHLEDEGGGPRLSSHFYSFHIPDSPLLVYHRHLWFETAFDRGSGAALGIGTSYCWHKTRSTCCYSQLMPTT